MRTRLLHDLGGDARALRRERVIAARRPALGHAVDLLPLARDPPGRLEPTENRIDRPLREPRLVADLPAVVRLRRVAEESREHPLRLSRDLRHGATLSHPSVSC